MPKMRILDRVVSMNRGERSNVYLFKNMDKIKAFCVENCPHQDEQCKGDCAERRAFSTSIKRRSRKS